MVGDADPHAGASGVGLDQEVRALVDAGAIDRASTRVVQVLGPELFGFLRGALGSEADADDVFAGACERIWRSIASFRWQCSLRTWAYVVARNESARFLDGRRRRDARCATPSALDDMVAHVRTETRSALRSDKLDKLRALRDELPVADRTLLILRVDRDLPWEDIARTSMS